jgi:CRISPR-associated protein Csb1
MKLSQLSEAIRARAALRRRQPLQPAGGRGDKIFPPTYPGEGKNASPRHVFEKRRIDGREVWCVLVDSVQSQANRLEECLLGAIRDGARIPHVVVDFSGSKLSGITEVSSLDAPHRVYDAILRDSLLDGKPFLDKDSAIGKRLIEANLADASVLLEVSPNALLWGSWNSTGQGGGLGAKFARCLTSEIIAVDVPVDEIVDRRTGEIAVQTAGRRTGSRIDPLGVLKSIISEMKIYKGSNGWDIRKEGAGRGAKEVKPSEINHGNITPSVQPLGITCDHLEHTFVLSFAALRRLRFGGTAERDAAGRTMLAALGLLALTEQDVRGYALRSRCDLVCDGAAPLEIVHADGTSESVQLDRDGAWKLYAEAFDEAKGKGLSPSETPLRLTPQPKLVEIVRKSQELALMGTGEGAEDDGASA